MKYGESAFDVLYLIFAVCCGVYLVAAHRDRRSLLMGIAAALLGFGDAFHLIPRVLNYFIDADFSFALGLGKLITSITMTVFYILMYHIVNRGENGHEGGCRALACSVYGLGFVRIALCLFRQNDWFGNGSYVWGIIRNVPFVILGAVIIVLYFQNRKKFNFRFLWLYMTLSFAFYLATVLGASYVPMLGMLMLPKTICYVLIIATFVRYLKKCDIRNA